MEQYVELSLKDMRKLLGKYCWNQYQEERKKKRGRQHIKWLQAMEKSLKEIRVGDWRRTVMDKQKWTRIYFQAMDFHHQTFLS